ncbi:hypothetical protein V6N13_025066 [Hibiscus sabdariffa]
MPAHLLTHHRVRAPLRRLHHRYVKEQVRLDLLHLHPSPEQERGSEKAKRTVTAVAVPTSTSMKEKEKEKNEKDPTQPYYEVKLFNRWSFEDLQVADISLSDYVGVQASKYATYVPHTAGRYSVKRFRKAQCPIVERLTNSLMMHGRNNGKKLMAVRIVKHAMEIIYLLTDQNPIQVIVDAWIDSQ